MAPTTPLVQPPVEDLRNALQIAQGYADMRMGTQQSYHDIARLILHALDQLGEPSEAAIQAASPWVRDSDPRALREARDLAAAVIRAQLTGTL